MANYYEDLPHRQTMQYAKDLAQIYVAEKAKRQKLEVAYQLFKTVFNTTTHGIIVLDEGGVIREANPAFGQLFQLDSGYVNGVTLQDLLPETEVASVLQKAMASAIPSQQIECLVEKPVQRLLDVFIQALPTAQLRGWVVSFRDLGQQKRLEQLKTEFINIAAYELRTPLTALLGNTMLIHSELEQHPERIDPAVINDIVKEGNHLNRVVDELLQFVKVNTGSLKSGVGEIKVFDLIDEVVEKLQAQIRDKHLEIRIAMSDPDLLIVSDAELLRSALYQVILNAVVYNKPDGFVRVQVETGNNRLFFFISDCGKGIAQLDIETIFTPFFQAEAYEARTHTGLGLGLSIAKRAVTQLDGKILVESLLGEGSTFTIDIPLKQELPIADEELRTQLQSSQKQAIAYARDMKALYLQWQEANRQLQEINMQLEQANKLKADFLGVVSHELRTPFVSIDFALQAFIKYGTSGLKPEQQELLEQMTNGFKQAHSMIDSLVAYASLLSKQGRLTLGIVEVYPLVQETVSVLQPMAERRNLTIEIDVPPHLVLPYGDKERIGESVWHLLHNAIKFTKSGGSIRIMAYVEAECLVIQVKDDGIGIEPERQQQIWSAFEQIADPLKRGMEGLGLGLALVRYVAVAHGGDVILQSQPGVGSIIGFWLPIA